MRTGKMSKQTNNASFVNLKISVSQSGLRIRESRPALTSPAYSSGDSGGSVPPRIVRRILDICLISEENRRVFRFCPRANARKFLAQSRVNFLLVLFVSAPDRTLGSKLPPRQIISECLQLDKKAVLFRNQPLNIISRPKAFRMALVRKWVGKPVTLSLNQLILLCFIGKSASSPSLTHFLTNAFSFFQKSIMSKRFCCDSQSGFYLKNRITDDKLRTDA